MQAMCERSARTRLGKVLSTRSLPPEEREKTTRLVKKLTTHLRLVEDIAARISRGTATFESRLVGRSSTYQARNYKAKKPRTTGYTQSFVVWWKLGRDVMNIHGSSAREVTSEVSHDHLGNSRHTFL